MALFSGIGHPFHVLPKCILLLSSARASMERLSAFLEREELPPPVTTTGLEAELAVTAGDFGEILRDVMLQTRPGFNLVVGPTGGGKSSLLRALIGELPPLQSTTAVNRQSTGSTLDAHRVAYCPSSAWLIHDTIQANVVLGRDAADEFDADAYEAAIEAVALEADLFMLPDGDQTVLGVRGTVSGGQRARIALARAVYSRAEVCVLDEPLVSLDVVTAKHCYEHAIGAMRRRGVVVMASSSPAQEWLMTAETVHIVREGTVEHCDGEAIANEFVPAGTGADDGAESLSGTAEADQSDTKQGKRIEGAVRLKSGGAPPTVEPRAAIGEYLKACGRTQAVLAALLGVGAHLLFVSKDIVLGLWSEADIEGPHNYLYLVLYVVICVAIVGAHWLRFRMFFKMALQASKVL